MFFDLCGQVIMQLVLFVPANGWMDCTLLFTLRFESVVKANCSQ